MLVENTKLERFRILICAAIGNVCLLLFKNYITKNLKINGGEVPYTILDG